MLIHLFEPTLDVLASVIRHSPGTDSASVAMSLVLLLQQSQRTEDFLRRELMASLQNARRTARRLSADGRSASSRSPQTVDRRGGRGGGGGRG